MPDNTTTPTKSSEKSYTVRRSVAGINSIGSFSDGGTANVITLTEAHRFLNGESVRVIGETGQIPDGLESNTVYFAITSGLTTNTNLKLAKTLNDAINGEAITINEKGGVLNVVSRVSDKNAGDLGHPIQFDGTKRSVVCKGIHCSNGKRNLSYNCRSWNYFSWKCNFKNVYQEKV